MIETERADLVAARVESLRRQGPVTDRGAEIANGEAELTELAFESGQAVLERTLITVRNHADWDSHERACFGEMRIETIANEAGVSATSIGRREDGVLAILSHADVRALIVEKGQRGACGRNDAHVYKIGRGTLREQLSRVQKAGHRLDAAVAIAVAVLGAYDLDLGYSEITIDQLARATGLKSKTIRQVIAKWCSSERLVCVGPNRFLFGHRNWRGNRFPTYRGSNFETVGDPDRNFKDAKPRSGGRPRNCGLATKLRSYKNSTTLLVDSYKPKACNRGVGYSSNHAPAREGAADHRHRRPERVRLDADAFKARVRWALDQAGSLAALSDEVAAELLAEAVRGAMPERTIEREAGRALSMFRAWAKIVHQTGFDWCPEVLFTLLRQKAETASRLNSWKFFDFIGDWLADKIRPVTPDLPSAPPGGAMVGVAREMAQVRPDPAAVARKHHDEARALREAYPRFRADVVAAVGSAAPISRRQNEAAITQAVDGVLAATTKAGLGPDRAIAIIAEAARRLVTEGRRFDAWGGDRRGGVRRALDDAINARPMTTPTEQHHEQRPI